MFTASFMRYMRSSMLEVIRQDFIRTARAKGLREKVVIYRHAFRNAVIPIITLLGFSIPSLLSGAVMTETIFGYPGLGKITVDAVNTRDYPVLLGVNAMMAMLTLIGALVADLLYAVADPRIKYE
jgi:peptide/nickel transport system permease protein